MIGQEGWLSKVAQLCVPLCCAKPSASSYQVILGPFGVDPWRIRVDPESMRGSDDVARVRPVVSERIENTESYRALARQIPQNALGDPGEVAQQMPDSCPLDVEQVPGSRSRLDLSPSAQPLGHGPSCVANAKTVILVAITRSRWVPPCVEQVFGSLPVSWFSLP